MHFDKNSSKTLHSILKHRRDVRGNLFKKKKIEKKALKKILKAGVLAPSVGYSQPWKFVVVSSKKTKKKIYKNFKSEYERSKKHFSDPLYHKLKLEGIKESPINIAVFYKKADKKILGQTSQKKMGEYSVVCAVQNMWLMARSLNIGIGWVSILKPKKVRKVLGVEKNYKLVAYLCVGYVKEFYKEPELKKLKWEKKKSFYEVVEWK